MNFKLPMTIAVLFLMCGLPAFSDEGKNEEGKLRIICFARTQMMPSTRMAESLRCGQHRAIM